MAYELPHDSKLEETVLTIEHASKVATHDIDESVYVTFHISDGASAKAYRELEELKQYLGDTNKTLVAVERQLEPVIDKTAKKKKKKASNYSKERM